MTDNKSKDCPDCEGSGVILVAFSYATVDMECPDCNGSGDAA